MRIRWYGQSAFLIEGAKSVFIDPFGAGIVRALAPRLVVPMHYGTAALDFLETPHEFLVALGARVEHLPGNEFDVEPLLGTRTAPVVAMPNAPS